ncbi:MAG: flagellar motor protein [bacterium]
MDLASIIGIVLGFGFLLYGMMSGGGAEQLMLFWNAPSLMIVLGGCVAAVMVNYPLANVINTAKIVKHVFKNRDGDSTQMIGTMVSFAEKARREGLLALEEEANKLDDPLMKKGIQLVIDGTEPEQVRNILEIELSFLEERHRLGKQIFDALAAYAPAFGMIGTLIGLIQMLANLDDPSTIGGSMAIALITTLYGAIFANLLFLPMAGKLSVKSDDEMLFLHVMVEGIVSIQNGENPRMVQEKLASFFAPDKRARTGAKAEGK